MLSRFALFALAALPGFCADWSPKLAADYMDSRQKEWSSWPAAKASGGTCLSCHTGLAYLIARPALRQALGETQPTAYEKELVAGLKTRLASKEPVKPSASIGVESVLTALVLARQDAGSEMSPETEQAFDRMWSLQIRDGKAEGAWPWYSLNLDPWETGDSAFFGGSLAAMAIGSTPAAYRERPEIRERTRRLLGYLQREQQSQPLQNRLTLLWASTKLPEALPEMARKKLVSETIEKQQPDGSWALASLGPWKAHPEAPASEGGSNYATAFVAMVLKESGLPKTDPALIKALDWLKSHQQPDGYWPATSMNKKYEAGSMQIRFMQDAATAFASLALISASN